MYICMPRCFQSNANIPIFPPNSAEGLHFSAFHYSIAQFALHPKNVTKWIESGLDAHSIRIRFNAHWSELSKGLKARALRVVGSLYCVLNSKRTEFEA